MAKMPDGYIDLTVTSPPYDNIRTYNGFDFDFKSVAKELYRITKPGGVVVWVVGDETINGSETGTSFVQALYFKKIGFNLYDTMIYRKLNRPPLNHLRYEQEFEYMFVFSKGKPKTINLIREECKLVGKITRGTVRNQGGNTLVVKHGYGKPVKATKPLGNIWTFAVGQEKEVAGAHPAIFPKELAHNHIITWSQPGDLVYDPFMGSGTVAKVSILNKRNWLGSEISKEYCKLIEEQVATTLLHRFDLKQTPSKINNRFSHFKRLQHEDVIKFIQQKVNGQ